MMVRSPVAMSPARTRDFPVVATLTHGGELEFDRPLPFICIHDRSARTQPLDRSLEILTRSAPNHVIADGTLGFEEAQQFVESLAAAAVKDFGACIMVELAESNPPIRHRASAAARPAVVMRPCSIAPPPPEALAAFADELAKHKVRGLATEVTQGSPAGRGHLDEVLRLKGLSRVVLEIEPVFYSAEVGRSRGLLLRDFAERFHPAVASLALGALDGRRREKLGSPGALGRRHIGQNVESIEHVLSRTSKSFDLILLLTPTNGEAAFERFVANGCEHRPDFTYRTILVDPDELKRCIYDLRIEDVEDPTLGRLLRDQREHIDNQLSMVSHRNTAKCLYGSLNVYGSVEDKLHRVARGIAEAFAPEEDRAGASSMEAERFRSLVLDEFEYYRKQDGRFDAKVEIRDDIASLMVTDGTLLIPRNTAIDEARAQALLAHEVGTHLLTFYNGKAQPLELMSTGLAGYEQLQEGLAVVGEYLAGGLTSERLRLLAARVIAVRLLLSGAEFVDVFREVHRTLGLSARHAFFVAMRVFRGGGFTKDAIYLRGVLEVLDHLRENRSFETLLLGKFAASQLSLVEELRSRQVLHPPGLLPRALRTSAGKRRLAELIGHPRTVFDLCQRETR